jgi:hypothetical protein
LDLETEPTPLESQRGIRYCLISQICEGTAANNIDLINILKSFD